MRYRSIFHLACEVFKREGIRAVLIGGFAVNYYKVTRQSADVDFLITEEDFKKILPLFEEQGYKIGYAQEVFARLKSDNFYLMDLDFMFVDRDTLDKIVKAAKVVAIAEQKFIVPSLEHLIALKLHSLKYNPALRENKDLYDIVELIRINKMQVKTKEFKELCLKFGTKELYDKILQKI